MAKVRLDVFLTENGYAKSRTNAQSLIMEGKVFINNQKALKSGDMINGTENIEVRGKTLEYVSRGGLKLEKAIKNFDLTPENKVCMDIGASTGGFTDCMLKNGAVKVYSVDVGYGQLAWSLRNDERVVNMERTNIRNVTPDMIADKIDFVTIDVSFISLKLVLPPVKALLSKDAELVCLIKPQFEAGREKVGKKGIVREPETHLEVLQNVLSFTCELGFVVKDVTFSPIRGTEGNIEYLMYLQNSELPMERPEDEQLKNLVAQSHEDLKKAPLV